MNGYDAVMTLAADLEKGPKWLPVVWAAYQEALRTTPYGGRFAGSWVLQSLGGWVPSLRVIAALGIVKKEGETVRGGRRAYYRMPDIEGVQRALLELGLFGPRRYCGIVNFLGAHTATLDPRVPLAVRNATPPNWGWDVYAGEDHLATVVPVGDDTKEALHARLPELRRPGSSN